jgi:hypothetical protein
MYVVEGNLPYKYGKLSSVAHKELKAMYEGRDLRKEVEELGITAMEDAELGSRDSAFAALDAIREHNKRYPEEKLAEKMEAARKEAAESMAGRRGEN